MIRKYSPYFKIFLMAILFAIIPYEAAQAVGNISTIAVTSAVSMSRIPALIAVISYILGIMFVIWGVLKTKEAVEMPQQVQIRDPAIKFTVGGALLALPFIISSMESTIGGAGISGIITSIITAVGALTGVLGAFFSSVPADINGILTQIMTSIGALPALLSLIAYILGLILAVSAILKLREHVENPQQVQIREPAIRFLVGGGLLALPAIMAAMSSTIAGPASAFFSLDTLSSVASLLDSTTGTGTTATTTAVACDGSGGLGGTANLGEAICRTAASTSEFPVFFNVVSYVFGVALAVWGLMKLKEHVLNPQQVSLWEPVSRFLAGGAFFTLPYILDVITNTVSGDWAWGTSDFTATAGTGGLDQMVAAFMGNIYTPMRFIITWFAYVAGIIFIMIGISRLMKSAQEGPRGPGGLGTFMTFLIGGMLLAFSPMMSAVTTSMFGDSGVETNGALAYTTGMDADAISNSKAVLQGIIQFMIILGLVSFARGLFIIRAVAEGGGQQASMMAGITHIIGGALAVNLGPFINLVQTTLGLTAYGVNFS